MSVSEKPHELDLHQLVERLVALRIPSMQLCELPRGGQLSIRGNVVNVPVDIQVKIYRYQAVKQKEQSKLKRHDYNTK